MSTQIQQSSPSKPVTDWWRPDLVALPRLTLVRQAFRIFARGVIKLVTLLTMRATVKGMENFPKQGPALVVINHLGDWDVVLLGASIPTTIDGLGKIELYEDRFVGPIFRAYGVIWVHRGQPDRKALRAALDGLAQGRMIAIAPEGKQTTTGGLEEGNEGAAFLAMKAGVPIVPVAMTGTENQNINNHIKRGKRAHVTLSVGKPFVLSSNGKADRQESMQDGTRQIMESLARMLPESYQGIYRVNREE